MSGNEQNTRAFVSLILGDVGIMDDVARAERIAGILATEPVDSSRRLRIEELLARARERRERRQA